MFEAHFSDSIFEVSHKLVNNPIKAEYASHMHTYCEMVLFITGDVYYNLDGNLYTPKKYDLLFIPKDTYHYLLPYCDTVYENYVLSFRADIISSEQYEKIFTYPYILNIENNPFVLEFFSKLDKYQGFLSNEDFKTVSENLTKELLIYCSYLDKSDYSSEISDNPIIRSILTYISQNIKEPLDVSQIATALNLSKSYIQNIFSEKMDIGLKQYILRKKIFSARNEIHEGKKPLNVSLEYGFNDYSNFYRNYKKFLGHSPKIKK